MSARRKVYNVLYFITNQFLLSLIYQIAYILNRIVGERLLGSQSVRSEWTEIIHVLSFR
jgi:hypothetical protein